MIAQTDVQLVEWKDWVARKARTSDAATRREPSPSKGVDSTEQVKVREVSSPLPGLEPPEPPLPLRPPRPAG